MHSYIEKEFGVFSKADIDNIKLLLSEMLAL